MAKMFEDILDNNHIKVINILSINRLDQ